MGRANWDAIDGLFGAVDRRGADGLDVAFDIVGYTAWTLTAMEALPHVVSDLGADAVLAMVGRREAAPTSAGSSSARGPRGRRGSRTG